MARGSIGPQQDRARAITWDEIEAVHQISTDNYVNYQHVLIVYAYKLVLRDDELVVFRGVEQPDEGRTVPFGPLALSGSGIVTPGGLVAWDEIEDLSTKAGDVVLTATRRKPGNYAIGDIPDFEVFWTLAQNLRDQN
ncbi:hypothetical protein GCM10011609_24710 [Lentzea pudingi]|uniref:Uncharacterized protein n=1 Tax=Lentzea pudingi TaxID=1789439 RepID=A0ABQ2HQJ6_9PSEU|nr:hypothetical protein [Lentzea pudingi]GGM87187.1 hypothetical protein GCM10011609_24710 [Lentzea pudingi]